MNFLGAPYPVLKHPRGLLHTQGGVNQIKSDLLVLLLTKPGERVMLPDYGTPLDQFIFEPNDQSVVDQVKEVISRSIKMWEPRIAVSNIEVTNTNIENEGILHPDDAKQDLDHILLIRIKFADMDDIQEIQELRLEVPING